MSPVSRMYKAGSIIYFDGDKADHVFVLQKGMVNLTYIAPETGMEIHDNIQAGEFFGVKSALGRFPREEVAQVLTDSAVLVMSTQEFEALAMKNHKLVMKMLKVFSNQLRRIGKNIQRMLDSGKDDKAGNGLYWIGEHYLKNKNYRQALYAYEKYLQYYPSGQFIEQCRQRIEMARSGANTGYAIASDGTSYVETPQPEAQPAGGPAPESPTPAAAPPLEGSSIDAAKQYYEAVSLYSQGRFEDALKLYKKIIDNTDDPQDEFIEKSYFDMGRCLISMNKPQDAVQSLTNLIKNFPRTENMKEALFLIGKCYFLVGDLEKARSFYTKVVGMPPNETINKKAQNELAKLGDG